MEKESIKAIKKQFYGMKHEKNCGYHGLVATCTCKMEREWHRLYGKILRHGSCCSCVKK